MKKFLIVASGVYLILAGLFGVIIGIAGFMSSPKVSDAQAALVTTAKNFSGVFVGLVVLWVIASAIGIMMKKNWARYSVLSISFFAVCIGLFSLLSFFIVPSAASAKMDAAHYNQVRVATLAFILIFFVAIPAFFIFFFSRRGVKNLYHPEGEVKKENSRPFGITVIGFLSLFGGFFSIISVFFFVGKMPYKMPLFGSFMLSGKPLAIYGLIFAVISVYIGRGLLKLNKDAWWTAICVYCFYILQAIINILTISQEALAQVYSGFSMGNTGNAYIMSLMRYRIFTAAGLIPIIAILIYLVLKKDLFLHTTADTTSA